jgi:F420-0:gamma-glutamyl ligase
MCVSQIQSLQAQLAAACSRAEAAERQQQASVTASAVALSRAQHDLQEARSAQFVAEEAHKTADAAAKLLAIKVTGGLHGQPSAGVSDTDQGSC